MRLSRLLRVSEWWEYKLPPALAAFYGALWIRDAPVAASWRAALLLVAAIAIEAAYVSLLNDLTDRRIDREADKPPRYESPTIPLLLLIATIAGGAAIAYAWRDNLPLVIAYAAGWIAFTLYSLPPFRFKARGLAGVICDACGAQMFPVMTAVLVASMNESWLAATAVWAFANGVRGIIWHQLRDVDADRRTNVRTFVVGAARATRVATWFAFPLEVIALAVMLWQLHSVWPVAALVAYALLMLLRPRRFAVRASIVAADRDSFVVLNEFNEGYLPIAILIASALFHRADTIVLAIHLLVFPKRTWQMVRELAGLLRLRARHASSQREIASRQKPVVSDSEPHTRPSPP